MFRIHQLDGYGLGCISHRAVLDTFLARLVLTCADKALGRSALTHDINTLIGGGEARLCLY